MKITTTIKGYAPENYPKQNASALKTNRNRLTTKFLMLLLLFVGVSVSGGWGQTITWSNTLSSTAWYTSTVWTPNTTSAQWSTSNLAQFANSGSATTAGINIGTGALSIGAIEVTSARTRVLTIGNSSSTTGNLTLNGISVNSISNVILYNGSGHLLTIQNNETGSGKTMGLAIANSTENVIHINGNGGITISSIISGASKSLTKAGSGTGVLTLSSINTYSGNTTISSGTLALSGSGSIANSPIITIGSGGTFNVSGLTTALTLGANQSLRSSATGSNTTATLTVASSKGLTLSAGGLAFTAYGGGSTAPLTITGASAGALALNGAPITVTTTSALAVGTYTLIAKGGSATGVSGTPGTLTVNGSGLASGTTGALSISSGSLILTVTASTFNVTYNSNTATSGTVPTDNTSYSSGAEVTVLGNTGSLVKTGYTFSGWNIAANGSGTDYAASGSATFTINSNTTLYAKWTPNYNTITFDGNGATSGSMSAQTIATDVSANLNSNLFEKTGYTFAGWATTAGGAVVYINEANYTMGTGNVTLYAKWTPNNNIITFNGNGSTGGSMTTQTIATEASANLTTNAYTRTGYSFNGWNTSADGNGTTYADGASYSMGTGNVTLYAIWTEITTPTITVSGTILALSTTYGTASSAAGFNVSGSALSADILITPPAGFEVSQTSGGASGYASTQTLVRTGNNVALTTIYVRLAATTSASTYSGNIDISNGEVSQTNAIPTSTVNQKLLTITGLTGDNKVYDGTTTATFTGTPAYSGLVNSESFTVTGTPSASFATAAAGEGKTITISGYTAPSLNYSILQPSLTANIAAAPLTITGISISNKTYNGNTTATITGTAAYSGLVNGETFTVTGTPIAVFADANVNTNISVTVSGYTAPSANYAITQPTGLTANITKADQSISGLATTDSKTTATSTYPISGVSASSGLTVSFASSNESVATISGSTVTIVGVGSTTITASQTGNGNYNAATPVEQILTVTQATNASDYFRTKTSGNWNATTTWESSTDGSTNWINATLTPTSTANTITVLNGHTVTVTSGVTVDQLTVNSGAQITINSGLTLTIANGADATDLSVLGILENKGTLTLTGTANFGNGSIYKWNQNGGSLNNSNVTWGTGSTVEIIGSTNNSPANLSQTFYNFTWNCLGQSSWLDLSLTSSFSVAGDFTINSTGGGAFGINLATATSNRIYDIAGNMIINSSKVTLANNTGIATLNIGGDLIMNSSNLNQIDFGYASKNPTGNYRGIINLSGNLSIGAGSTLTCTDNGTNDDYGNIVFEKQGSQTFTNNGTISWVDFDIDNGSTLILNSNLDLGSGQTASKYNGLNVQSGGTLDFNGFNLTDNSTGEGTLEVINGGTLLISSTSGISVDGSSGNVLVGYPVYNTGANYTYKGTLSQVTGDGLPATVNNLTIDNAAGVTITNNAQTVSGSLTINSGKRLIVAAGKKLTVNGTANNNGIIKLESNATNGTATLKGDIGGNADVEVHLPAASTRTWWYLASPVDGASYTVFGSNKVGEYDETTRSYSSPFAGSTALVAGKGYVVKMTNESAANYVFTNKTLNTGDISVTLTRTVTQTPDNAKRGFNLVGNPYPSYLNWNMAYNLSTNIRPTIWYRTLVYDEGSTSYKMDFHTYNASLNVAVPSSVSGYIPPMQAFWVKVNADPVSPATVSNGTLNMTNDMRSHDESEDGNPLKAPAVERPLVRLVISNGSASDETVIVAHTAALDGYDSFDSEKMANDNINKPEIYSIAGTQELVISGVSPLSVDKQLALGVRPGKSGDYSISVGELKGIPADLKVVLKDKHTGAFTELTAGTAYSFNTDGNTVNDRFSLLFRAKDISTDIDNGKYLDLQVYGQNGQIVLRSAKLTGAEILVFNALGQPLYAQQSEGTTCTVRGNFTPGVYLVKVNNEVRKVTLK